MSPETHASWADDRTRPARTADFRVRRGWSAACFTPAIPGATHDPRQLVLGFFPAGSVVFGWFFEKTRGSLSVAILLHMGAHLNNPHLALPQNPLPAYAHTAAFVLLAVLLIGADRTWWRDTRAH
ncbi:MAG: hypothetical protein JW751_04710 [Polyangiaceae bacterium]|nr:hypothetical protein [Polyangiaceae bacterium]